MSTIVQLPEAQTSAKVSPVANKAIGLGGNELLVNFNLVIQEALGKVESYIDKGKAIIRCDNLPHVLGEEEEMKLLSNNLIDFILQHPPEKSKLFIYIKCSRTESGDAKSEILDGLHQYEICFHTNSCNEPLWQECNQEQIAQCEVICKKYYGSFTCAFGNADSLFKLSLFGKL